MRKEINPLIKRLRDRGLEVFDMHTHFYDVLGVNNVCCRNENSAESRTESKKSGPSLLEKLDFRDYSIFLLKKLFALAPKYIDKNIIDSFHNSDLHSLTEQMNETGVSKSVLLTIDPKKYDKPKNTFDEKRFIKFSSLDISTIKTEEIESNLERQIKDYGIRGIKLHPNLQRFFPIPEKNSSLLSEKLREFYRVINKNNLPVLIHAGVSFLRTTTGYSEVKFGIIDNFFDDNGSFFDLIKTPIVIAHLGSYNILNENFWYQKIILENYTHVYFDTSGQGSRNITKFLKSCGENGVDRLVFGSDSLYFDMNLSAEHTIKALRNFSKENIETNVEKVFSNNPMSIVGL